MVSQGGFYVGPPESLTGDEFDAFLQTLLPLASNATRDSIRQLYPPATIGDTTGEWERVTDFIGDFLFSCSAQCLARAFSAGVAYRYIFGAIHGSDVPFTFYWPGANDSLTAVEQQLAKDMQRIITNFVTTGIPCITDFGQEQLPLYGAGRESLLLNGTRPYLLESDSWDNSRCAWWQRALYA